MPSSPLSHVPALRLLIPFAAGIVLGQWMEETPVFIPIALAVIGVGLSLILYYGAASPSSRLRARPWHIVAILLVTLSLGWMGFKSSIPAGIDLAALQKGHLVARIDGIEYKDFSMSLNVNLKCAHSRFSQPHAIKGKIRLSTDGCDYSLRSGDLISFPAKLNPITNLGNPDEIDYARILNRQGFYYSSHCNVQEVARCGYEPTLLNKMENLRQRIISRLASSNLNEDCQRIVIALVLGGKQYIDTDTRWQFSHAGIAHILALSGLHVGILSFIIWWLLIPLDYLRLKKLRLVLTLMAIVIFDIFTGMQPSVIRATIMIGFVFTAHILYRKSTPVNTLAAAALIILVFSPQALFDVGFQLSFITVAALLLLAPSPAMVNGKIQLWGYVKATVITSFIAMASTIVLTAYYFHSISLLAVVSNLLVLPIFPFFMMVSIFYVIVVAMGGEFGILETCVNVTYHYISWMATHISATPHAHIDNIYITGAEVMIYYAALALAIAGIKVKRWKWGVGAGALLAIAIMVGAVQAMAMPKSGMVIFNSYRSTPVFYYHYGVGYLWIPDNDDDELALKTFKRQHAAFLARRHIDSVAWVHNSGVLRLRQAMFKPPYSFIYKYSIQAIGAGKWKQMETKTPLKIDYLIVGKNFHGDVADVKRLVRAKRWVLSGASYETDARDIQHKCDSLRLPTWPLMQQGALLEEFD